ncbi:MULTISPECIES: ATP synthase F0 subunit B [Desulfococcus]|jgi:F-type H+-transporting ATPase subunit b|uniref:ATP synthase subunit b n=1 Tax=Desulfococcus multivorans DSM 2059 TaxID=1121405 RepID=S7TQ24_DESML|nr:ATP synthase F0 subunit B [Desulfococcus multivorans]AOY57982.1 AtpF3: ATP synthase, subunit beta (ATP synthase F0 sector subunit beta) [Desulfococcus multivorans]AQV00349.1 ATPase [Desulfococcus multivorans]EPR39066.1 H+transporting two-sector ATPase B/B' subunit [Desulfococcus multivorans DSM 2059]MDX9817272.1 ATP synthase F0 subunit B [Desulfococcus multivorans]SJZ63896.1 F-type H+-transporting ATPase subunit b [Desulfococcus multivorans DSM 2059]
MISVDSSVFIQIVNFLFLIWILNKILYRPIRDILAKRKDRVAGMEDGIQTCLKEAEEKNTQFSEGIRAARSTGAKQKEKLIQEAENEEKAIVRQINEKAQAELAKIREKIAKDAEEVRQSLLQEVDKFANDIGEKILGRAV